MNTPRQRSEKNVSGQSYFLRRQRSVLFWVFLLTAIPSAFILIFFAAGFRYDTSTQSIIRMAALSIEATPTDVQVSVDGTAVTSTETPFVGTIRPGNYSVSIKKENYQPWQKDITVYAGQAALFPEILLFEQNTPQSVSVTEFSNNSELTTETIPTSLHEGYRNNNVTDPELLSLLRGPQDIIIDTAQNVSYITPSFRSFIPEESVFINGIITTPTWNSDNVLLYALGEEIWSYYPTSGKFELLLRQTEMVDAVTWHPNGRYIFFTDRNGVHALERDSRDFRQQWLLSSEPHMTVLHTNRKGDVLYFAEDDTISNGYQLQLFTE